MAMLVTTILKVQRAKEHLDALEKAIRDFESPLGKPKAYRVSGEDDLQSQECVLKLEIDEPSLTLGILAGDFISSLRSSLDWLAWQLAAIKTNPPSEKVCFPVLEENTLGAQGKFREATLGIPGEAIAIMQELQPYQHGNAAKDTHLWRLNKLWNIEKHRHLIINAMTIDLFVIAPPGTRVKQQIVDNRGEVRFPLSLKNKVRLDPTRCKGTLRFGDESEGVLLSHGEFLDMYEFVSDKIIPRFKRFFPQTPVEGQPIQI